MEEWTGGMERAASWCAISYALKHLIAGSCMKFKIFSPLIYATAGHLNGGGGDLHLCCTVYTLSKIRSMQKLFLCSSENALFLFCFLWHLAISIFRCFCCCLFCVCCCCYWSCITILNICRVPGFEPEILRSQTDVLPMSYTHPWELHSPLNVH